MASNPYAALLVQAPHALRGSLQLPLEALQAGADLQGRKARRIAPQWMDIASPAPALQRRRFDLVLLPAIWGNPATAIRVMPQLPRWLRGWRERGAAILAIGTSVEWMAEAGMLDGCEAVVHWSRAERFARRYPQVRLVDKRVFSPLPRVFLASSVDGALEASMEMVEALYSQRAAEGVRRHFASRQALDLDQERAAGQGAGRGRARQDMLAASAGPDQAAPDTPALAAGPGPARIPGEDALARLRAFVLEDLANPPSVAEMARFLNVSTRTLRRYFTDCQSTSPLRWLQGVRLDRARELLARTSLQVEEVARAVGYDDPSYFARQFRRWLGQTPSTLRRRARA